MKTKDHVAVTALCVVNLCYLILSVVSATLLSSSSMPKCVWHLDIHMQGYRYDANSVRNFDKLWYILIFIKQMYIMMLLSMSDLVTSINIFMFIFNPEYNMNWNKNRESSESTQRRG
jgi:hypothetical protein